MRRRYCGGRAVNLGGDCGGSLSRAVPGPAVLLADLTISATPRTGNLLSSRRTGRCCHDVKLDWGCKEKLSK